MNSTEAIIHSTRAWTKKQVQEPVLVETVNIQNGTYFDLDADGFAQKVGWVSVDW